MELFNEFYVLIILYHMLCLTEFVPDFNTQEIIGYSLVFSIFLNFGLNLILIGVDGLKLALRKAQLRCLRRKNIKS